MCDSFGSELGYKRRGEEGIALNLMDEWMNSLFLEKERSNRLI